MCWCIHVDEKNNTSKRIHENNNLLSRVKVWLAGCSMSDDELAPVHESRHVTSRHATHTTHLAHWLQCASNTFTYCRFHIAVTLHQHRLPPYFTFSFIHIPSISMYIFSPHSLSSLHLDSFFGRQFWCYSYNVLFSSNSLATNSCTFPPSVFM